MHYYILLATVRIFRLLKVKQSVQINLVPFLLLLAKLHQVAPIVYPSCNSVTVRATTDHLECKMRVCSRDWGEKEFSNAQWRENFQMACRSENCPGQECARSDATEDASNNSAL